MNLAGFTTIAEFSTGSRVVIPLAPAGGFQRALEYAKSCRYFQSKVIDAAKMMFSWAYPKNAQSPYRSEASEEIQYFP